MTKKEINSGTFKADYFVYLFFVLYVVILFAERTAALVKGLTDPAYIFYNSSDFVQWYTHILTAVGLAVCFITSVTVNRYVFVFLFTRSAEHKAKTDYGKMAITVAAVLVGGMTHTNFTLLWLQFVSYGALLISMLIRTVSASFLKRPDVTKGRLAVSYLYIVCLSMAIPVVYSTQIATRFVFVPLEIVTALVLVFVFCFKLAEFYRRGGLTNFGILSAVYAAAADTVLFVLRFGEMQNYFLIVFLAFTVIFFIVGRAVYGNRTLTYFSGRKHPHGYFEGWYLKITNGKEVLSFIPSYHTEKDGRRYAMLQIIGTDKPLKFVFGSENFRACEDEFRVLLSDCRFSYDGISLNLEYEGHSVKGDVAFDGLTPPKKDIMGFFAGFPFMECKHGVLSMRHSAKGKITIDGKVYDFTDGHGYIEKDFGTSFPSSYLWTQGCDGENSVMLSVARIPYLGLKFTGCIAFVYLNGREYRLATYNGAKVLRNDAECAVIKKGNLRLEVYPLKEHAHPLAAPDIGAMSRTVYESAAAEVRYVLAERSGILLDMTVPSAGYERGE